jgi:hypothetical protein
MFRSYPEAQQAQARARSGLALAHWETIVHNMSTDALHHSRHSHRRRSFRITNYADLPDGTRRKPEESDPYLAQLHLLREEQRSLVTKTVVLNLLLLLSVIACLWFGAMWILATYPPPD